MLAQTCAKVFEMDTTQTSDEDLARQAIRDPAAVSALYRRYLERVYRYLYARVGNRAEAEDLTSQVFLAVIEGLPRYRERGCFAAWLFGIARRKASDYFRQKRPQAPLDDTFLQAPSSTEPLLQAIQVEERQRL